MSDILKSLADVVENRMGEDPAHSYVASLAAAGPDAVLKKVAEEAGEIILAAKNRDDTGIIHETADLWFHTMVMLALHGLRPEQVLEELARRFGTSGIEEKAGRHVPASAKN